MTIGAFVSEVQFVLLSCTETVVLVENNNSTALPVNRGKLEGSPSSP